MQIRSCGLYLPIPYRQSTSHGPTSSNYRARISFRRQISSRSRIPNNDVEICHSARYKKKTRRRKTTYTLARYLFRLSSRLDSPHHASSYTRRFLETFYVIDSNSFLAAITASRYFNLAMFIASLRRVRTRA